MSNHPPSGIDPANHERYLAAQRVTWVSVVVNVVLTILQIVVGYFGRSQALMADGIHSLSDLLSDFLVLFANRHGSRSADADHPYGHARIETAATLILGVLLIATGVLLLWGAGMRLQDASAIQKVHPATLWIGLLTLVGKESLFRYMMSVAKRLRSQMLMANAWHSRSDAASSLVVVAGIAGNLAGFTFLDLIAAVLVAFMIARMGWKMGYDALSELIDTSLDAEQVAAIRESLESTPGVLGLHELKTRKMGDNALVDAHVLVDPKISVSEGHYIAETARSRVLKNHDVLDVMVHIDPEDDTRAKPSVHLPGRKVLLEHLHQCLSGALPEPEKIVLHYLEGKVEVEIFLSAAFCDDVDIMRGLKSRIMEVVLSDDYFSAIHLHRHDAL
ncbi:cation diffusion facilitator family transporter [Sulfurirhabdus autotrophica]|uniref:Cation diffusion facilitator family transporter n=1 Tax=Sulfurirhabdus autotrophica TaxID=1706046 RepID=A0A4R3Y3X2_9PROT|nr:cation diffusion facilitator family transporter [Sulfurirhabdus autotrophica]TCV86430.1 cation diffusion facilitator family transporter [Sulfurirhabdus autotrophica]